MSEKTHIKRVLRVIALGIVAVVVLLVAAVALFLNLSPEFGSSPTAAQLKEYSLSDNHIDGKFENKNGAKVDMSVGQMMSTMVKFFSKQPNTVPDSDLPMIAADSSEIANRQNPSPRVIWFGHSAVLLQMNGKIFLIDPMFGDVPAPHPVLGTSRFSGSLPIEIEKLPFIDAVILSHDHYDHLDYGSIVRLKDKVGAFYTPLGVGNHLRSWGVSDDIISELDWWDEAVLDDIQLACTPAQHFSGRGMFDNGNTLWASWVIKSAGGHSIYFSGDSGYGPHFKAIGNKYGPFDFAMLECGQYNEKWKQIHMMPEETVDAAVDLRATNMMPIHWGAFKLAFHTWTDPVERSTKRADDLGVKEIVPVIGESIEINSLDSYNTQTWWLN